jgi:hypothetical protein
MMLSPLEPFFSVEHFGTAARAVAELVRRADKHVHGESATVQLERRGILAANSWDYHNADQ